MAEEIKPLGEGCRAYMLYEEVSEFSSRKDLVFAIWDDGTTVVAKNIANPDGRYLKHEISKQTIEQRMLACKKMGLFEKLPFRTSYCPIHYPYHTFVIRGESSKVELESSHMVAEHADLVATSGGVLASKSQHKLDVLLNQSTKEYLLFRLVWSDAFGVFHSIMLEEGEDVSTKLVEGKNGHTILIEAVE